MVHRGFSPNVVIEVHKDSTKSAVFCWINVFLENGKTPLKNIMAFFFLDIGTKVVES